MEIPYNENKKNKKIKQRDKTAARDYDPYFGDMTKLKSSEEKKKEIKKSEYQQGVGQLRVLFPNVEKALIDLIWEETDKDFDKALDSLCQISGDLPPKPEPKEEQIPNDQKDQKYPDIEEEKFLDIGSEEEEMQTPEYKKEIDEMVLETIAMNFINKYPRFNKEEVIEKLRKNDGRIIEVRKELVEKYGEAFLKPLSVEEMAKKAKKEFLEQNLKGKEVTEEFKDLYYNNNIQEHIMQKIKETTSEKYRKEQMAFERDFPALSPEIPKGTPDGKGGIWGTKDSIDLDKFDIVCKCFPLIDKCFLQYVLYNFSEQLPEAINYLKSVFPQYYVDPNSISDSPSKSGILINERMQSIDNPKIKPYQLPQKYKKTEKSKMENPITNTQRQQESIPAARYSEIRKEADAYFKVMHKYILNEAQAHSFGQHSEANKFRQLADEYLLLYNQANENAMNETLKQRNQFTNQLEKIDLHGLHIKEAEKIVLETLESIKEKLRSGRIKPGPQGIYNYKIITVLLKYIIENRELESIVEILKLDYNLL